MSIKQQLFIFFFSTLFFSTISSATLIKEFDETIIQAPFVDSNTEPLTEIVCRTRDHLRWDFCSSRYENGDEQIKSFAFANLGENKIVPKSGFGIGRQFEFMFEGFARSDLGLLIWDSPDEVESHGHLKIMMFFPRKILPAIRYISDSEKDLVIVTLPTTEEVIFNGKSKEILSGVLLESSMKQDDEENAMNPEITYNGKGVVVEADRLHDYPVGLEDQAKNNLATIRKNGYKDCKIPTKGLWYTDEKKGGNVFFNKKYVTDQAFDQFLKKRCNFSIY